jgi:EAL domain-containing protein (putative c-di-GMP-specific phosphodiesterase class I)
MTSSKDVARFLGLAFASADLLFEIDPAGTIAFAAGATKKIAGADDAALMQGSWRLLFDPSDHGVFAALIDSLGPMGRKGPVRCRLPAVPGKPPRYANVFACRLPQIAPNISCALSFASDLATPAHQQGLMDPKGFEEAMSGLLAKAQDSGLDVELALVEVAGLSRAVRDLPEAATAEVLGSLTDVLRAEALGGAASRLRDDQFALMREKTDGPDTLGERLKSAAADAGLAVEAKATAVALDGGADPQTLRALRYTLDAVLQGAPAGLDIDAVFRASLESTLEQARAFTETVKTRKFKLVYQPIVDLRTRQTHHYEALVRFPGEATPFDTIRMAEELDLVEVFDLAVAEMVIGELRLQGPEVRIAVNVSGRSFLRPRFLDQLLVLTAGDIRLKTRLIFEITESAALASLDLAEERIQRLRRDGFSVCIDDFGAGAASLQYLRNLTVDAVKIDGQYVRQIQDGGRDTAVVKHLAALCRDLGVETIAEMIESDVAANMLQSYGVDMGQGYAFSRPLAHIPRTASPAAMRRKGSVESWG